MQDTLTISLSERITFYSQNLIKSLESFEHKDKRETIHKLRITSRRLDGLFQLDESLKEQPSFDQVYQLNKEFRKKLGSIRALDVYRQFWKLKTDQKINPSHQLVKNILQKQRKKNVKKFLNEDYQKRFAKKKSKLKTEQSFLSEEQVALSCKKQIEKILKTHQNFDSSAQIPDLHQVRIHTKVLRYLLEEIQSVSQLNLKEIITNLKTIQQELGKIQDLEMLHIFLDKIAIHKKQSFNKQMLQDLLHINHLILKERESLLKEWKKTWPQRKAFFDQLHSLFFIDRKPYNKKQFSITEPKSHLKLLKHQSM